MLKVPVPSVQIIRAILRKYHAATHTAQVQPVLGPASLVGEIPVLMSCRPDLLTAGRHVAVLTWSDVGGLVLGPYGAVPDDPPSAGDTDTVDGIHAAAAPTANKLLAMNANAKFPAHTVEGTLTAQGDVILGSDGSVKLTGGSNWFRCEDNMDVRYACTFARLAGDVALAMGAGSVGVYDATPAERVDVNGNVRADDYIEYSEMFTGDALAALKAIRPLPGMGSWKEVNHDTLPERVRHVVRERRWFDKRTGEEMPRAFAPPEDEQEAREYELRDYERVCRSLSATVQLLQRAVVQLLERVEALAASRRRCGFAAFARPHLREEQS